MAVQRLCTIEDKPFLRALWQRCFGDTDSFLDYYYDNRFYPEYTVCTIEDDKLVVTYENATGNKAINGFKVVETYQYVDDQLRWSATVENTDTSF